jgi:four helix bundle protein
MHKSVLKDKSDAFAVLIVKLAQRLVTDKKEYTQSKKLLKRGTAIGAFAREAVFAERKKEFIHKMSMYLKKANASLYWLGLLQDANYILKDLCMIHFSLNKKRVTMLESSIKISKSKL